MAKKKNSNPKPQRPYPQFALEKALRVPVAIKLKNGGNPFDIAGVAKACGISEKSANFFYITSSAIKFHLVEKQGDRFALTPLGKQLVYHSSPKEELELKRKAFLEVDIFRNVFNYYQGNAVPEDEYFKNALTKEFELPEGLQDEFIKLYKENVRYLSLDTSEGAKEALGKLDSSEHSIVLGKPEKGSSLVCFVMMPFKERTESHLGGFFEEVLNALIIPAGTAAGFEVRTAERQGTEIIHSTIVNEILDADLAVCDLTEHNPNVLFELGIRLAHEKPVAIIHANGTPGIFDVDNVLRVFGYEPQLWKSTIDKDLPNLTAHIRATWEARDQNETYMGLLKKLRQSGK
jgi:hypothetical protein